MFEKFIEENIERDIKSFELSDDLYARYLKYCEVNKFKAISRNGFGRRLSKDRIGAFHRVKNTPARWGVKLLPCKY